MFTTKSSSLGNHSSCSSSLQHMLWSDQSSSTNSSLPRVGTSPRTIFHPQPLRGARSGLLRFRSLSPEQPWSVLGQRGSQASRDETDDRTTHPSVQPTNCDGPLYMSREQSSPPKYRKSHRCDDSRSEIGCSPRIPQDLPSRITCHQRKSPELTSTLLEDTPSECSRLPLVEQGAYDEQTVAATCGSISRRPSSTTDRTDEDALSPLSPELPSEIDPQELLDFLHEFEEERRCSKRNQTEPSPHPTETHCDNSSYSRPSDEVERQRGQHQVRQSAQNSTASDIAQPPSSRNHASQRTTSPDDLHNFLSADDSIPSLLVKAPDSVPAPSKSESRYRPPELFIGRFVSDSQNHTRRLKTRRKSDRLDIRALPNYDDDSIDEGT